MTTDNFCFYLQNRLIQTGETGGQWYSDSIPCLNNAGVALKNVLLSRKIKSHISFKSFLK
jgi:hypothetical protein